MDKKFRQVADDFYVAPQLVESDFVRARELGIKTIINNRPDDEEPGQLPSDNAQACAQAAGLSYVQVPVVSGGIFPDHIAAMREAVDSHDGPFLAYCRSGTRSCYLWGFLAARDRRADDIVRSAAKAGYDVSGVMGMLRQIHQGNRS